jgi:hypothetical protein
LYNWESCIILLQSHVQRRASDYVNDDNEPPNINWEIGSSETLQANRIKEDILTKKRNLLQSEKRRYRRINAADRDIIAELWNNWKLPRSQIARATEFSRHVITRELKRGFIQTANGEYPVYDAEVAQMTADEQRRNSGLKISSANVGKKRTDGTRR